MQHPSMSGIDDIESCKNRAEIILREKSFLYNLHFYDTLNNNLLFLQENIYLKSTTIAVPCSPL